MGRQVCAAWATPADLCCEGGGTTTNCVDGTVALEYIWTDDQLLTAASNILHALTGFRYSGVCGPFTVWPCTVVCGCERRCDPCRLPGSHLELPVDEQVASVAVEIDGVVLAPTSYRLFGRNILVRTDGEPWPLQSFGVPGSGAELEVTFTTGTAPPPELVQAAATLACELKKACNGDACGLPPNVASVVRRGVDITLTDIAQLMRGDKFGIPLIDYALMVHGGAAAFTPTMHDPARKPRGYPAP